jgi:hypothetical protein
MVEKQAAFTLNDIYLFINKNMINLTTASMDEKNQYIALSSYLLNLVDCSLSSNCSYLNRMRLKILAEGAYLTNTLGKMVIRILPV